MSLDKHRETERKREFTFCWFYSLSHSAIRVWHAEFTNDDLAMTYPFTLNDFERTGGDRDSRMNETSVYTEERRGG